MNYIRQILFEMRHHKMMTWVSIAGTALSIFLVMAFFMVDRLPMTEVSPENNRSRMLYGGGFEIKTEQYSQSGAMSYKLANKIYGNLDGIEMTAYSAAWKQSFNVGIPGKLAYPMDGNKTDANFWKIYDFHFLYGKPYNQASVDAGERKAVITNSVARKLFGKDDVAGEEININSVPYLVTGVIEDVSPIMKATFSNIYLPIPKEELEEERNQAGDAMVHLLMQPGVEEEDIKQQVKVRYDRLNIEYAKFNAEAIYHDAPHNAEYLNRTSIFSNVTPDLSREHIQSYIIYTLLILLPAINLSSMMRGRLRHRISEIGVRRAFGAKRKSIILQILSENFIITLLGGAAGLILSYLFVYYAADYFFNLYDVDTSALEYASPTPSMSMLFTMQNFLIALAICFVLNLLSAFLPAWKASKVEPAEAISKSRQ